MTTGSGEAIEEHPLNYEHQGDELKPASEMHAAAERLGKAAFTVHGMAQSIGDVLTSIKQMLMGMKDDHRAPVADYPPSTERERTLMRALEIMSETPSGGDYHEAPRGDDNGIKIVVVSTGAVLLIFGILGVIAISNQNEAIRSQVAAWKFETNQRLEQLERQRP